MAMIGQGKRRFMGWVAGVVAIVLVSSCTLYHSKIPIAETGNSEVSSESVFVTEDDSGLALLGIFVISEPDHYSVLIERARRRYKCERLHHIQLDFYSDYWLFVGFPIARITAICEPIKKTESAPEPESVPEPPAPSPAPAAQPAVTPPVPVAPTPPPEASAPEAGAPDLSEPR